jgi:hypothetical protein
MSIINVTLLKKTDRVCAMNRPLLFLIMLLMLHVSGFAKENYKNVVALSGGFPELVDIEYQRSFGPLYVALKPGVIVMLLWYYNNHDWPAYPSIRLGVDVCRFRHLGIGPQVELGYIYVPGDESSYLVGSDYSEKWKCDYTYISIGPALRYGWRRLEVQLCAGLTIETRIKYSEESTSSGTSKNTEVLPSEIRPMARLSAGFMF